MSGIEIKEKLQKFFDKEIFSVSKHGDLYYVTMDVDDLLQPVIELDINGSKISEVGIPLPQLETFELIWSKALNMFNPEIYNK